MPSVRAVSVSISAFALAAATLAAQDKPMGKATTFKIRIENIGSDKTLKLSSGGAAPFVISPGVWAVYQGSKGPLFAGGQSQMMNGLQALAEEGNTGPLSEALPKAQGVKRSGTFTKPSGSLLAGPATPGKAYEFEITAEPGEKLTVAMMFGQSNDLFYAPSDRGIALFGSDGKAVAGDMTPQLGLWDAGTEVNEEPGLGPNQAPRQKSAGQGTKEHEPIAYVQDKFTYPKTESVLRFTITPSGETMSSK